MLRPHRSKAGNRRAVTFVVAAALHVAGVVALVSFTPSAVKEALPNIPIKFWGTPAVAPKLGGGGETAAAQPKKQVKRTKIASDVLVPPSAIVETTPDPIESTELAANDTGTGGEGGPDGPGVPWGDPNSECIGEGCVEGGIPGSLPGGPNPVPVETLGITPVPLHQPFPPYPASARATNLAGLVVVEIVVGVDGRVQSARLVKSQPVFDAVALDTVRKWRYQPVVVAGRPIVWKSQVNLRFQLR